MYYCVPAVLFLLSWSLFFGFGVGVGVGISATSVYGYWYCICIGVLLRVGLSKKDVRVRSLGVCPVESGRRILPMASPASRLRPATLLPILLLSW